MKNIKNNKGFMLVEVIIVTVVVVIIMTSLYLAFNRVYNAFELKSNYTDIDAIYAIKMVEDQLTDDFTLNDLIGTVKTNGYVEVTYPNENNNIYKTLFEQYKINKLYLIKKEKIINEEWPSDTDINQTFKDYFSYLKNAVINNETSEYLFVIETYENTSYKTVLNKYAYLELN